MNNFFVPPPPMGGYYQQTAYDAYGNPIMVETPYQQQPIQQPEPQQSGGSPLGLNFSNLIGATIPIDDNTTTGIVKANKKPRKKKEKNETTTETGEIRELTTAEEVIQHVETDDYRGNYYDNVNMLHNTINQVDQLASDVSVELQKLLRSNIKGKYTYVANLSSALNGILSNKVTAIREMNNITKSVTDAEYRRYKDMRSMVSTGDDNKQIMDLYNAYINLPKGAAPPSMLPNSMDITAGLNGVVKVDGTTSNDSYGNFINNLTPEQNMMIMEDNPNIEEVIIYDQSTGKKYFDWIDNRTGQSVPNLPTTSMAYMEDFQIDPRLRIAKNINMRKNLKVIYINENILNEY